MQKRLIVFSGFSGAIAVALGAMGAHYLKSKLEEGLISESTLQTFDTSVKYQVYHTLALFVLAAFVDKLNIKFLTKAAFCFMAGIVLFSGSLYLITTAKLFGFTNIYWLGPITPIGGLFFIIGWLLLSFAGMKKS